MIFKTMSITPRGLVTKRAMQNKSVLKESEGSFEGGK